MGGGAVLLRRPDPDGGIGAWVAGIWSLSVTEVLSPLAEGEGLVPMS